jgi:hypothetical protein
MREKAQGWVNKDKSSKFNKCILTFLLDKQFLPGIAFRISSICTPFSVLEDYLMRIYYEMLPMCGICQSICQELRQLDRGFFGVDLPHPGVECFVAQVNKLLTHYSCSSGLGIHMQVSMELLIIEGGVLCQVLFEPYSQYGRWVMHNWLQSLWEKVDMFEFCVEVHQILLEPPQEGDGWLMVDVVNLGFSMPINLSG